MSRRRAAEKREILPDAKFSDVVLNKFMNSIMIEGKKSVAEGIVYGAFDRIQKRDTRDLREDGRERGPIPKRQLGRYRSDLHGTVLIE